MTPQFTNIEVRLATPDDTNLPTFDNTKLVALDTCVTWGILTYQMHKVWPGSKKSMALNVGTALHEVFAAVRLWQLYYYQLDSIEVHENDIARRIIKNQAERMYGKRRWNDLDLWGLFYDGPDREALIAFCMQVLHTSGFEEDPADKKRSYSVLEEVVINYINRWDMSKYPIWIRDKTDPNTDVGIEIGYDVVVTFVIDEVMNFHTGEMSNYSESYRFIGKLDGLHYDPEATNADLSSGEYFVVDNKTTSRMMEGWGDQYEMDTQMVGYMIAMKAFAGLDINRADIILSSVPVPKTSMHGGQVVHTVHKEGHQFSEWFTWFYNLAQIEQANKNNPIDAPRSPHSCTRYFGICSMLPFCTANKETKLEALSEMETKEWNPLAKEDE